MPDKHAGQVSCPDEMRGLYGVESTATLTAADLAPSAWPLQNGLAPRVVELLRRPGATSALSLLQILKCMYEHHPRPKASKRKHTSLQETRHSALWGAWAPADLASHPLHPLLCRCRIDATASPCTCCFCRSSSSSSGCRVCWPR